MPVLHTARIHPAVSGPILAEEMRTPEDEPLRLVPQKGACILPLEITPADLAHVDRLAPALARMIPFLSVACNPAYADMPALMEKAAEEVKFRHGGPEKVANLLKDAFQKGELTRDDLQHLPEAFSALQAWYERTEPLPVEEEAPAPADAPEATPAAPKKK